MEINWKKKYNEALERARALREEAIEKEYVNDYVKDYEAIFPELAESEDEEIRKHIVTFIMEADRMGEAPEECAKWLAYLEKQKEQKPLSLDDKVKHPLYMEGFEAGKQIGAQYESVFGKQKEQKPEWSEEDEKILVAISKALGCDTAEKILANDGVTLVMAAGFLESLRHRPKQEWSKEDGVMLNNIIWNVHMKSIKHLDEMDDRSKYEKYENFLKSLPTRFNLPPKQEWGEEDDRIRKRLIQDYEEAIKCADDVWKKQFQENLNWLKSLRPSWKPSEEQMGIFGRIVNDLKIKMVGVTIKEHRTLESLYNDIKKLM